MARESLITDGFASDQIIRDVKPSEANAKEQREQHSDDKAIGKLEISADDISEPEMKSPP